MNINKKDKFLFIPLSKGKEAIINSEDFSLVQDFKWYTSTSGYAVTEINRQKIWMHRLILGISEKELRCDHINNNKLDNRRSNLRKCTTTQNNHNRACNKNNKTGLKGVSYDKFAKSYRVHIGVNKKTIHLGLFKDRIEAARAYNLAAKKYHKEFAFENKI